MKLALTSLALAACSTLGPMPITTGAPAAPAGRPAIELQGGGVPAFHLSSSTRPSSTSGQVVTQQLLALVEPHLAVPGLVLGARGFGKAHDRGFEPLLGYRHALGATGGVSLIGYGTRMRGGQLARYEATRAGGELAVEGKTGPLFGQFGVAVTRVVASGRYCVDGSGHGVDCGAEQDAMVDGGLEGFFPAATLGAGADLAGKLGRRVHRARLAVHVSVASMPRMNHGIQIESTPFLTAGLTLTLGLAADR